MCLTLWLMSNSPAVELPRNKCQKWRTCGQLKNKLGLVVMDGWGSAPAVTQVNILCSKSLLMYVMMEVYLLSHVERIMHGHLCRTWWYSWSGWWWLEYFIDGISGLQCLSAGLTNFPVQLAFLTNCIHVGFGCTECLWIHRYVVYRFVYKQNWYLFHVCYYQLTLKEG